ncbi:MAG: Holliday junction resolvase RuvX [Prevotellaceae bacterium]|jgi:putative Holliday junction resolvase|nr:Holliday junction resolvase RuvX [Prevotellaceae bacterium]
MGRILAIDYGRKRVGLAATDPLKMIANSLTTVPSAEVMAFLEKYTQTESVELFVVGLPKQMNNEPSASMRYITPFVGALKKRFPHIPVAMFDERFTSKLAHQTMIDGGLKKKDRQNKALVDQISATIILQGYLESQLRMTN